jgi:hypothetical protein
VPINTAAKLLDSNFEFNWWIPLEVQQFSIFQFFTHFFAQAGEVYKYKGKYVRYSEPTVQHIAWVFGIGSMIVGPGGSFNSKGAADMSYGGIPTIHYVII